jgi:Ser/Thr protein kinase RdoA (MazF antagonist)
MNPGNVLFSKAEPTQVYAFIDFQTVSLGNIVHDVHQVLSSFLL